MEGYVWKKGRTVPVMKRRFVVQKGTMLMLYTSEDERKRLGAAPRKVLEVVGLRDWMEPSASASVSPPASPSRSRADRDPRSFEVVYLGVYKGGATASHPGVYKCRADSKEARQLWVDALRHALNEPDRIARDEIEEAQRDLVHEGELHQQAVKAAADAVEEATRLTQKQAECDARIQQNDAELGELQPRLDHAQLLLEEAIDRCQTTRDALERAQERAHDIEIGGQRRRNSGYDDADDDAHDEQIARLAAQLEVDTAAEDTQRKQVTDLQTLVAGMLQKRQELAEQFQGYSEQGQRLRQTAGHRIEEAQGANRRRKLRITSWSAGGTIPESASEVGWTPPTSQLDPLVEGYLQCKHPTRNTMHRRYYVLVGNTLCWYTDVDAYTKKMDCPSGVVHVASVADWDGHLTSSSSGFAMRLGGILSPRRRNDSDAAKEKAVHAHAHAFGIGTVEGTTLLCSAPTRDSAANWTAALHISLTMPPLSPHRATAAKARRDSFDLLASMTSSATASSLPAPGTMQRRHSSLHGELKAGSTVSSAQTPAVVFKPVIDNVDPQIGGYAQSTPPEEGSAADRSGSVVQSAQPAGSSTMASVHVEGYLVQRSSASTSIMMKKKYCVLRGLEFGVFDSFDAYQITVMEEQNDEEQLKRWASLKDLLHVCGVREWDGHARLLQYHHAFQIQTIPLGEHQKQQQQQQAVIYCSAASASEKIKWLHGIREALLKYRDTVLSPTRRQDSMVQRARQSILRIAADVSSDHVSALTRQGGVISDNEDESKGAAAKPESEDSLDDYAAASSSFHDMMEQYYAEHHPSKLHDVPMLVEKYRRRERALVEHLDRIHGTALMDDPRMVDLLQRLAKSPPTSPHQHQQHQQTQSTRASSGVRSGLADFVAMTGYLSWWDAGEFAPSYCVLSINKLVRYRSQSHHATEPHTPLASYLISSVYEFPPPPSHRTFSPRSGGSSSSTKHIFYLAAAVASSSSSKSQASSTGDDLGGAGAVLVDLVLAAPTGEDKLRWMAKIRSGLGFAHAHADGGGVSNSTSVPAGSPSGSQSAEVTAASKRAELRRKLVDYYLQQNPRRVGEVDSLLAYFAGRERQLLVSLDSTYGTAIRHDDAFVSLLPSATVIIQAGAKSARLESVLSVKHPTLGADFQRCVCVLGGPNLSCYDTGDEAASVPKAASTSNPPLLSCTITKMNTLNAKLSKMLVFSVESLEHGVILLRADSQATVNEWMRVLRAVVDARQNEMTLQEMNTLPADGPLRQLFAVLMAFYRSHNPDKAGEVGTLLRAFRGRELQLLHQIDGIYHSRLSLDPANQVLCSAIASSLSSFQAGEGAATISTVRMEGYLTKRGHLMPSMRKRYCVLVDNQMSYYVTQDDSRDSKRATKPQGSFVVASVSDWSGQTSARNYSHGLEIEATDGRTFFCSAPTADEKNQWVEALQRGISRAKAAEGLERSSSSSSSDEAKTKAEEEKEQTQVRRGQLRERLVQFYHERNPRKIGDLELLLACYAGRELALLEAIDEAYKTSLARDDELLALVPPSAKHSEALLTLKYDGHLRQAADQSWYSPQSVYVAVDGLTITFFATREAFKSGMAPPSQAEVTLLAVKSLDGAVRFAVETTEHKWIYFEATNTLGKRQWMLVLQAALDTVLARNILNEEQEAMRVADGDGGPERSIDISTRGPLLVRMDLDSLETHAQLTNESVAMVGCYCLLQNTNELVVCVSDDDDKRWRFTVRATRAWHPGPTSSPVAIARPCRFPFQVMTDQQFVVSCGAASDIDRAKWIHQIRLGAEQATALEMLEEQLLEAKEEFKTRPQLKLRGRNASVVIPSSKLENVESSGIPAQSPIIIAEDDEEVTKGPVLFQLVTSPKDGVVTPKPAEAEHAYITITERGLLSVFEDEAMSTDGRPPVYRGQAIDFARSSTVPQPPLSPQRHLMKLFGRDSTTSASQPISLVVQDALSGPVTTRIAHFFPTSESEREVWMTAFTACIGIRKGEALLADEKVILALEREGTSSVGSDNSEAKPNEHNDDDNYETEEKGASNSDIFSGATIEGILTPWNASGKLGTDSPLKLAKLSKLKPCRQLYAVLVGCRLMGFTSQADALANFEATATIEGSMPLLDVEIAQVMDWEAPRQADTSPVLDKEYSLESLGFKVDASTPRGTVAFCFTAPSMTAKRDWIRVIRQEVDFSSAERYLDDDAKAFARQVAEDLNATANVRLARQEQVEGYVRVRHHFLGAIWRERYLVLRGSRLVVYANARDAAADNQSKKSIETHEVSAVDKWQPILGGSISRGSDRRFGFRVINEDGVYLECTVTSEAEATRWMACIRSVTDDTSESKSEFLSAGKVFTRDAALPFISGASMEGFLRLKDRVKRSKVAPLSFLSSRSWKTRYCVLMGTHLLLYESQAEAISSDSSTETSSVKPPLAVYEVTSAKIFCEAAASTSTTDRESEVGTRSEAETDSDAMKFTFYVSTGGELRAKAQSPLERKRWLNAIEDALMQAAACIDQVAQAAVVNQEKVAVQEQVKNKLLQMQTDALRQSILLREALQFAVNESDSDESDSDKYYESDDGENAAEPNALRHRSKSDYLDRSPESSPMRRKLIPGVTAFTFDQVGGRAIDTRKEKDGDASSWSVPTSFSSFFTCFCRCFPAAGSSSGKATNSNKRSIAPLGIPGFPSSAALSNPLYECEYYKDDGYDPDTNRW